MNENIINLHRIAWTPLIIMIIVFVAINFTNIYVDYLKSKNDIKMEFDSYLKNNTSYIQEDIYYKKESSLNIRLENLFEFFKKKYNNMVFCVIVTYDFNINHKMERCTDRSIIEQNEDTVEYNVFLGNKHGATYTMIFKRKKSLLSAIPTFFIYSCLTSMFCAFMVGMFLIKNLKIKIINPFETKLFKERQKYWEEKLSIEQENKEKLQVVYDKLESLTKLKDELIAKTSKILNADQLKELGKIHYHYDSIEFIETSGQNCIIHTKQKKEMKFKLSLKIVKTFFKEEDFIEVRRNILVNPSKISKIQKRSYDSYEIVTNNYLVPIGKTYIKPLKKNFYQYFEKN